MKPLCTNGLPSLVPSGNQTCIHREWHTIQVRTTSILFSIRCDIYLIYIHVVPTGWSSFFTFVALAVPVTCLISNIARAEYGPIPECKLDRIFLNAVILQFRIQKDQFSFSLFRSEAVEHKRLLFSIFPNKVVMR